MARQLLKEETSLSTSAIGNRLPSPINHIIYISFYGRRHVFSHFYPIPLQNNTLILNSEGKPEEPNKNIILDFKSAEALYQWKKAMASPKDNKCYALSQM